MTMISGKGNLWGENGKVSTAEGKFRWRLSLPSGICENGRAVPDRTFGPTHTIPRP